MVGHCLNCGKPLPRGAQPHRKFDSLACRVQYHRRRNHPEKDQRQKVPPSNGTGDPIIDKILNLQTEATLRRELLIRELNQREEQGRLAALESSEKWKEDRVLDADTRRKVARYLAEAFDPSRTR